MNEPVEIWNVGSLKKVSGVIRNELWKRKVDVCDMPDTRWKIESTRSIGAKLMRYRLWQKGRSQKR